MPGTHVGLDPRRGLFQEDQGGGASCVHWQTTALAPPKGTGYPTHLVSLAPQLGWLDLPATFWTYMIVSPLPEVEGSDGPEEQQQRTRNEDHSSDLEQTRRAGGLQGHGGICLQGGGGGGEGTRVAAMPHTLQVPTRCPWGTSRTGVESMAPAHRHCPPPPASLVLRRGNNSRLFPSPEDLCPLLSQEVPSTGPMVDGFCAPCHSTHTLGTLISFLHHHTFNGTDRSLIPEVSLGPFLWPHSTPGLGTQGVLTGGLQNSMSSGPTMVIGTLSEFSAMAEVGEVGQLETLSLCPNDECPLHTKQQQQRPALASPSVPTPSSTSPLPSPSTLEQPTQLALRSQKCPLRTLSSPKAPVRFR